MDLSENDLSENDPVKEIAGESEGSKVSFEDCVATFLKLLVLDESILLLPVFVLWLGAQAVRALFHHHILSSDYVAEALSRSFLFFLIVLPVAFLFVSLSDSGEDDSPRSLFSYASGTQSIVPPPENRV